MVDVGEARNLGFRMTLHEEAMRDVLGGGPVRLLLGESRSSVKGQVETHVRATASAEDADNYVTSMASAIVSSDSYGFDFNGPYQLGERPIAIIGVPKGRGPNPSAKPPLMVEAETHALSSVPGFKVGSTGENIT